MPNTNISSYYQDAFLANLSYANGLKKDAQGEIVPFEIGDTVDEGGVLYTIIDITDNASGYKAYAFKDLQGNITIAHRGTEVLSWLDWSTDAKIGLDVISSQMDDAIAFNNRVTNLVKNTIDPNFTSSNTNHTGHSLGGGIANLMAVMNNAQSTSFDAPIVSHLLNDLYEQYSSSFVASISDLSIFKNQITEIAEIDDIVHNIPPFGSHLGNLITVNTPDITDSLGNVYGGDYLRLAILSNPTLKFAFGIVKAIDAHSMSHLLDFISGQSQQEMSTAYFQGVVDIMHSVFGSDYNVIQGTPNADTLFHIDGRNIIIGGEGSDTANYSNSQIAIDADMGANSVIVGYSSAPDGAIANQDILVDIENITGSSFNDTIIGNQQNNTLIGGDGDDDLDGGAGNDLIFGDKGNDIIEGGDGDDYIVGGGAQNTAAGEDRDILRGGDGNDHLIGDDQLLIIDNNNSARTGSDDILEGEKGDDYLSGFNGDDAYIYNVGDGKDTIEEHGNYLPFYNNGEIYVQSSYADNYHNQDAIVFGEGIRKEDVLFSVNNGSLLINFANNSDDQITIKYGLIGDKNRVETLRFFDGQTIDLSNLDLFTFNLNGDGNDNVIIGSDYFDVVDGFFREKNANSIFRKNDHSAVLNGRAQVVFKCEARRKATKRVEVNSVYFVNAKDGFDNDNFMSSSFSQFIRG